MRIISLFILTLVVSSCSIQGLTSDYKKTDSEFRKKIVESENPFLDSNNETINKITGSELKEELNKYDKSIIYLVTGFCSGNRSLDDYKEKAEKLGYKFFIVSDTYADLDKVYYEAKETPIYIINHTYYNANWRIRYTKRFFNDLLGRGLKDPLKIEDVPVFMEFQKNKYIGSIDL